VNDRAIKDEANAEYFKPREGDDEWNTRLERGFKLVDEAYKSDPRNPQLTPQQRADVIEKHAAVRFRAAGFGPLKYQAQQLRKQVEELKSELAKYKTAQPSPVAETPTATANGSTSAWNRLRGDLQKIARTG
jgi:hypothetical protein